MSQPAGVSPAIYRQARTSVCYYARMPPEIMKLPADLQDWLERTAARWGVTPQEVLRHLGVGKRAEGAGKSHHQAAVQSVNRPAGPKKGVTP